MLCRPIDAIESALSAQPRTAKCRPVPARLLAAEHTRSTHNSYVDGWGDPMRSNARPRVHGSCGSRRAFSMSRRDIQLSGEGQDRGWLSRRELCVPNRTWPRSSRTSLPPPHPGPRRPNARAGHPGWTSAGIALRSSRLDERRWPASTSDGTGRCGSGGRSPRISRAECESGCLVPAALGLVLEGGLVLNADGREECGHVLVLECRDDKGGDASSRRQFDAVVHGPCSNGQVRLGRPLLHHQPGPKKRSQAP